MQQLFTRPENPLFQRDVARSDILQSHSERKDIFAIEAYGEITAACNKLQLDCERYSKVNDLIARLSPDITGCVILDVDFLGDDLPSAIGQLQRAMFAMPVIAVAADARTASVLAALRAGATDFCMKPLSTNEFAETVRAACDRDRNGNLSPLSIRRRLASLTSREREVVDYCIEGASTKSIARRLCVTYQTIDKHRKRALRKMEVDSTVALLKVLTQASHKSLGFQGIASLRSAAG